jgi:peptidase M48-like protein
MKEVAESGFLIGLAWFAAVNAAATIACATAARLLPARYAEHGGLALCLRLLPAGASLLILTLFLPAHWRLEPAEAAEASESFGRVLYVAAAGAAVILVRSLWRAGTIVRAAWRLRACDDLPRLAGSASIYEVRNLSGVSLVGLRGTRILVGDAVLQALSSEELAVALAHEAAHRVASDNVTRAAMYCAPDFLWLFRVSRRLESTWHAAAECAADARAVAGSAVRALDLASALVKVSRLAASSPAWAASPAWSALHDPPLLAMRVRRLVGGAPAEPRPPRRLLPVIAGVAGVLAIAASNLEVAALVHQLTETLIARLP